MEKREKYNFRHGVSFYWGLDSEPACKQSDYFVSLDDLKEAFRSLVQEHGIGLEQFCISVGDVRVSGYRCSAIATDPVFDIRVTVTNHDGIDYRLVRLEQSGFEFYSNLQTFTDWLHEDFMD